MENLFLLCSLFENLGEKFMGITGIVYRKVITEKGLFQQLWEYSFS